MSKAALTTAAAAAELMAQLRLSPRQAEIANAAADRILAAGREWLTDVLAGGADPGEAVWLMTCGFAVALKVDTELAKHRQPRQSVQPKATP